MAGEGRGEVSEKRLNTCWALVMDWNGEGGREVSEKMLNTCGAVVIDWKGNIGEGGERLVKRC